MKTIGIIAEYNPFHNGHAYQIARIREQTHADFVIVAMSGDFVQRGTPAIFDKYCRTNMALQGGADFVFELPTLWATASAEKFAMAGVTLFDKMGCVDGLCFGAESDDLPLLSSIAEVLAWESIPYQNALSSFIKEGLNFPTARAKSIQKIFPAVPDAILQSPNNILAIEYLKSLKRRHSNIQPLIIKREGAGYHDTSLNTINTSATALRQFLFADAADMTDTHFTSAMPASIRKLLLDYIDKNPLLSPDDFSTQLGYLLLALSHEDIASFGDCNIDIANRLCKNKYQFQTFLQFCAQNKSRDITYARMCRILNHILLNIKESDYQRGIAADFISYLRPLGFSKSSASFFSILKENASVPLISKLADAPALLSADALWMLEKDIFAADIYEQMLAIKKGEPSRNECTRELVVI